MKRLVVILAICMAAVLAGCYTTEPTNVTENAATLHSQVKCHGNSHGNLFYELDGGGGFIKYSPYYRFDCDTESGYVDFAQWQGSDFRATGLNQGTLYRVRLAYVADNGTYGWYDKAATNGGGDYTQFITNDEAGGAIGHDYQEGSAQPSVSAPRSCSWRARLIPGVLVGDPVFASTYTDCSNTSIGITATCRVELRVRDSWDNDNSTTAQGCIAASEIFRHPFARSDYGAKYNFSLRLNDKARRWTQSYLTESNRPNRGCSLSFTTRKQHVLSCEAVYGNYYPQGG